MTLTLAPVLRSLLSASRTTARMMRVGAGRIRPKSHAAVQAAGAVCTENLDPDVVVMKLAEDCV